MVRLIALDKYLPFILLPFMYCFLKCGICVLAGKKGPLLTHILQLAQESGGISTDVKEVTKRVDQNYYFLKNCVAKPTKRFALYFSFV